LAEFLAEKVVGTQFVNARGIFSLGVAQLLDLRRNASFCILQFFVDLLFRGTPVGLEAL
jgi:hypothetical protein